MGSVAARVGRAVRNPAFPFLSVMLMAIRFAASSVSAFFGVEGYDTTGFDAALALYGGLVPLVAAALATVLVLAWPQGFGRDLWILLALLLSTADAVFWAGEVDPAYRLIQGPWAGLPLGLAVTATVLVCGIALEGRIRRGSPGALFKEGFRALYGGFAVAYLLGALRFIDYRYALGSVLPSGGLWLLDYGPVLLLGLCSVYIWARTSWPPRRSGAGRLCALVLPLAGIVAGVAVSQGLGGFILSNTLAWGGAYEVFTPTSVSLGFVGFSVGCFLAAAWTLRGWLPRAAWRFVVAGVSTAALAGILAFAGTLASVAGILLGLLLAARGLVVPEPMTSPDSKGLRPTTDVAEYRE